MRAKINALFLKVKKHFIVITKDGRRFDLHNRRGKLKKIANKKLYLEFPEGTFPISWKAFKD